MKFFIASIAILLVTVNANPVKEKNPLAESLAKYLHDYVENWVKTIPGWKVEDSVEKNMVNLITNHFEGDIFPAWNPDLSAKKNIEIMFAALDKEVFDENKSLSENIRQSVLHFIEILPIPSIFPRGEIADKIQETFENLIETHLSEDGAGFFKLGESIDLWIESLNDVDGKKPADAVSQILKDIFKQINIPGYSADNTLQDDATAFAEYLFDLIF